MFSQDKAFDTKDRRSPPWTPKWTNGDWRVDFYVAGERIRKSLGIRDEEAWEIAGEYAELFYKDAWEEVLNPSPTFAEASLLYMQNTGQNRYLKPIIEYFGPDTTCREINHVAIARAAAAIKRDWNTQSIHRMVETPIEAVISFIEGRRRKRGTGRGSGRWLMPEEAERMLSIAAKPELAGLRDRKRRILKVIAFLLGSGACPGETWAVRVGDFNWPTSEVLIRAVDPGAGKSPTRRRWVHLPPKAVSLIGDLPSEGRAFLRPYGAPFILEKYKGGQLCPQFRKICRAAGLGDEVHLYTLRHTWATWFSAQVGDHDLLLDRGGWAKSDTARIYRRKAPADLARRLYDHGWDFRAGFGQ